ncbi:MAG: ATP-grasp domain-containing protein [Deltaproteobacteria bacterium]|nr:ATP-grasp domain-containing protein [Deltaproteobacteria bacterium]
MKTLITGVSTRAIAESAVKSGHDVFTIDYFGDHDQKQIVENYSLLRDFNLPFKAENLIAVSSSFDFDSLVYISNFENFPELLDKAPQQVRILGNSTQTLRKVRDWKVLRDFMTTDNIPFPETLLCGEEMRAHNQKGWLLKPTNSGGGSRIKAWEGERLSHHQIIQRYVEGIPASISFLADGHKSLLIGLSAQLIGLNELGANGCTWCGNILPPPVTKDEYHQLIKMLKKYAASLTETFGLKGACGIDFIIARDHKGAVKPIILEVNPRYTASMELAEMAYGLNIYSLHIHAVNGTLPHFSLLSQDNSIYYAKGILFSQYDIKVKSTRGWMDKGIRDIPFEGDEIGAGQPVCTILTEGGSYKECESSLFSMAETIKHEVFDIIPIPAKGNML